MKCFIKKMGFLIAFAWLFLAPGAAQATAVTECDAWIFVTVGIVANDCYVDIYNEPVVVGVDKVYTRADAEADVYHGATFVGYYSASDVDAIDYPGTVVHNGLPVIEGFSSVYAEVRRGTGIPPTVDTGFDPFCLDGIFTYRLYGVIHTYTTRSICGGYLGHTVLWET